MVIATSITESYLQKSEPLFASCREHFEGRRICFTIGFMAVIPGWECIQTELPEYPWQPENRKEFYCLQHGEFVKYLPDDINPDDMILFIDSDMVLQRKWDLNFPSMKGVQVTASSFPLQTLQQVISNLGVKGNKKKKLCNDYVIIPPYMEFCTGFLIATLDSWEDIYRESKKLYPLLQNFKHHAAWQLLINLAIINCRRVFLIPDHVCNAIWYSGTKAVEVEGKLMIEVDVSTESETKYKVEPVYFNHTKFNI